MNISDFTDEDKNAMRESLLKWISEGKTNPLIALDFDLNGDGVSDAFGLNEKDELVIVPGVKLSDTVSISTGEEESE